MSSESTVLAAFKALIVANYASLGMSNSNSIHSTLLSYIDDATQSRAAFLHADTTDGKQVRAWGCDVESLLDYETHDETTLKLTLTLEAYYALGVAGSGRELLRTHIGVVNAALRADETFGGLITVPQWVSGPNIEVINEPSIGKILRARFVGAADYTQATIS